MAKDSGYVAIKDGVAYTTGSVKDADLVYHVIERGQEVPSDVPEAKVKQWLDAEVFPPFGAVAPKGSDLATLGSAATAVAQDPAETHRRLAAAHEALHGKSDDPNAGLIDPAGDPTGEPKATVDPGVARLQRLSLEDMDKDQLKAQAESLNVEIGARDSVDTIRGKIQARLDAAGQPASE